MRHFKASNSAPVVFLTLIFLCIAMWNVLMSSLNGTVTINTNFLTNANTNYVTPELASQTPLKCDAYLAWDGSGADGAVLTTNIVMSNWHSSTNWGHFYFNSQLSNNIQTTNSLFYSTNVGFNLGHVFNVAGTNYSNPLSGGVIFEQTNDINLAIRFDRSITSLSAMFKVKSLLNGLGADDHDMFTVQPTASGEAYVCFQERDGTGVVGTQCKARIERAGGTTTRSTDMNIKSNVVYTVCIVVNGSTTTNSRNAYVSTTLYSNNVFQTIVSNCLTVGADNGGTITNTRLDFKEITAIAGKASEKTSFDTNWIYWSDIAFRFKTNVNDGPAKPFTPNECSVRVEYEQDRHIAERNYYEHLENMRLREAMLHTQDKNSIIKFN